ncbi:RNA-binding protein [Patescibacteria group bacterium]|nr:RNA-binding protein [Patescibacteria group bacterium]
MVKKLFVGGLSWNTNDATLSEYFSSFGSVISANVVTDRYTGKSRGFGFVEMATEEEAEKAIKEANGADFDGRRIIVSEAKPQEKREFSGSGGSGGSGGGYGRRDDRDRNRNSGNRGGSRSRY